MQKRGFAHISFAEQKKKFERFSSTVVTLLYRYRWWFSAAFEIDWTVCRPVCKKRETSVVEIDALIL